MCGALAQLLQNSVDWGTLYLIGLLVEFFKTGYFAAAGFFTAGFVAFVAASGFTAAGFAAAGFLLRTLWNLDSASCFEASQPLQHQYI